MVLGRFHLDQEICFPNEAHVCVAISKSFKIKSTVCPRDVINLLSNSPFHLSMPG